MRAGADKINYQACESNWQCCGIKSTSLAVKNSLANLQQGLVRAAHLGAGGAMQPLITCSWPLADVVSQRTSYRAAAEFEYWLFSFSSDAFSCYTHDIRRRISAHDNATFRQQALNCICLYMLGCVCVHSSCLSLLPSGIWAVFNEDGK